MHSRIYVGVFNSFRFRKEVEELMKEENEENVWRSIEYKYREMIDSLKQNKEIIDILYLSNYDIRDTKYKNSKSLI